MAKEVTLVQKVLAEFVAMTLFVWVGCGTAVSAWAMAVYNSDGSGPDLSNAFLTSVSLAFGLGIAVLAMSIAPISGGHINPAVTFAFIVLGEIDLVQAAAYIVAQFVGALFGAAILYGSFASDFLMDPDKTDEKPPNLLGSNFVRTDLPLSSAFLAEAMGTFLLVWTVMMTAVHYKSIASNLAPIIIGFSVALAHFVLVPITGCGINPARSFGPHLVVIMAGEKVGVEGWWVYYTAPFVGAAVAALLVKFIFGLHDEDDGDDREADQTGREVGGKQDEDSHGAGGEMSS